MPKEGGAVPVEQFGDLQALSWLKQHFLQDGRALIEGTSTQVLSLQLQQVEREEDGLRLPA